MRCALGVALALSLMLMPRVAHADSTSQPIGLHFTGQVVRGPDAGVQIDGFLTLTSGGMQVSGTLSTFAGILMGRLSSYTPMTVTGTMNATSTNLSLDLSALSSQSASMTVPALQKLALPQFAHLGVHPMLQATGRAFPGGSYAGSFSGPTRADEGSWTAVPAVKHSFDFSAITKTGPKWSISGQAAVAFGGDGVVSGLYISDDLKGIYPIHGVAGNNWMSLVLPLGNNHFLYGSGSAGNIDVYQFFSGTFYGPGGATSGKWSAAITS